MTKTLGSLVASTLNSQLKLSTEILFFLADVCRTAVRKPVGKVNAPIQNNFGGCVVLAHLANNSTRAAKSLAHEPKGFSEEYV